MYDGPYLVLERSLHFFKIQVGSRQDTVSTLRLKPCRLPPDAQLATPPRRGRPSTVPAAATVPADVPRPPAARRRRVTFRCPVVVAPPELPLPPPLLHPSGRPARRVDPPQRFLSSLDTMAWGGNVGDHGTQRLSLPSLIISCSFSLCVNTLVYRQPLSYHFIRTVFVLLQYNRSSTIEDLPSLSARTRLPRQSDLAHAHLEVCALKQCPDWSEHGASSGPLLAT
jgi:hypothetical protein